MNNINYSKIKEITIHNQAELNDIPLDFKGRIMTTILNTW